MNNKLVPKSIVDKNGKATTVKVRPNELSRALPNTATKASPSVSTKISLLTDEQISKYRSDGSVREELTASILDPSATDGDLFIATQIASQLGNSYMFPESDAIFSAVGRARYAKNPDAPLTYSALMSYDPDSSPELLMRIWQDGTSADNGLASNPATPRIVMEAILTVGWLTDQFKLAENPSAPPLVLEELAAHGNWSVRAAVAVHPRTPEHVIKNLARDNDPGVSDAALKSLGRIYMAKDDEEDNARPS